MLEVGAGLGVLTAWLAQRVALVHAVEVDRRLEPALTATLAGAANVNVVWADAVRLDLAELDPPPGALFANLPYNVATPVIIRALPTIERYCVMVQREIADRLFASPGTKAYGAVSVLVQLACERLGSRKVSRKVFAPEPNVDSALVAFRRRPGVELGDEWEWTSRVVHGGVRAPPKDARECPRARRARRRRRPRSRACGPSSSRPSGSPSSLVSSGEGARAPAKVNLCLRLGPLRPDGYHRVTTLLQAIDLYDELELEPAGETDGRGVRRATRSCPAPSPRWARRGTCGSRSGSRSPRASAAAPRTRPRCCGPCAASATANELHEIARALGTDVPFFLSGAETGFCTGRGDRVQALPDFPRGHAFVVVPAGARASRPPTSTPPRSRTRRSAPTRAS